MKFTKQKEIDNAKNGIRATWDDYGKVDFSTKENGERLDQFWDRVEQIHTELNHIRGVYMENKNTYNKYKVRDCAVGFRQICENLIIGPVIINSVLYDQYIKDLDCDKLDSLNRVRLRFKAAGIPYFPEPCTMVYTDKFTAAVNSKWLNKSDGYFTEEDFENLFSQTSNIIHRSIKRDYREQEELEKDFFKQVPSYCRKLNNLIKSCSIRVSGTDLIRINVNDKLDDNGQKVGHIIATAHINCHPDDISHTRINQIAEKSLS